MSRGASFDEIVEELDAQFPWSRSPYQYRIGSATRGSNAHVHLPSVPLPPHTTDHVRTTDSRLGPAFLASASGQFTGRSDESRWQAAAQSARDRTSFALERQGTRKVQFAIPDSPTPALFPEQATFFIAADQASRNPPVVLHEESFGSDQPDNESQAVAAGDLSDIISPFDIELTDPADGDAKSMLTASTVASLRDLLQASPVRFKGGRPTTASLPRPSMSSSTASTSSTPHASNAGYGYPADDVPASVLEIEERIRHLKQAVSTLSPYTVPSHEPSPAPRPPQPHALPAIPPQLASPVAQSRPEITPVAKAGAAVRTFQRLEEEFAEQERRYSFLAGQALFSTPALAASQPSYKADSLRDSKEFPPRPTLSVTKRRLQLKSPSKPQQPVVATTSKSEIRRSRDLGPAVDSSGISQVDERDENMGVEERLMRRLARKQAAAAKDEATSSRQSTPKKIVIPVAVTPSRIRPEALLPPTSESRSGVSRVHELLSDPVFERLRKMAATLSPVFHSPKHQEHDISRHDGELLMHQSQSQEDLSRAIQLEFRESIDKLFPMTPPLSPSLIAAKHASSAVLNESLPDFASTLRPPLMVPPPPLYSPPQPESKQDVSSEMLVDASVEEDPLKLSSETVLEVTPTVQVPESTLHASSGRGIFSPVNLSSVHPVAMAVKAFHHAAVPAESTTTSATTLKHSQSGRSINMATASNATGFGHGQRRPNDDPAAIGMAARAHSTHNAKVMASIRAREAKQIENVARRPPIIPVHQTARSLAAAKRSKPATEEIMQPSKQLDSESKPSTKVQPRAPSRMIVSNSAPHLAAAATEAHHLPTVASVGALPAFSAELQSSPPAPIKSEHKSLHTWSRIERAASPPLPEVSGSSNVNSICASPVLIASSLDRSTSPKHVQSQSAVNQQSSPSQADVSDRHDSLVSSSVSAPPESSTGASSPHNSSAAPSTNTSESSDCDSSLKSSRRSPMDLQWQLPKRQLPSRSVSASPAPSATSVDSLAKRLGGSSWSISSLGRALPVSPVLDQPSTAQSLDSRRSTPMISESPSIHMFAGISPMPLPQTTSSQFKILENRTWAQQSAAALQLTPHDVAKFQSRINLSKALVKTESTAPLVLSDEAPSRLQTLRQMKAAMRQLSDRFDADLHNIAHRLKLINRIVRVQRRLLSAETHTVPVTAAGTLDPIARQSLNTKKTMQTQSSKPRESRGYLSAHQSARAAPADHSLAPSAVQKRRLDSHRSVELVALVEAAQTRRENWDGSNFKLALLTSVQRRLRCKWALVQWQRTVQLKNFRAQLIRHMRDRAHLALSARAFAAWRRFVDLFRPRHDAAEQKAAESLKHRALQAIRHWRSRVATLRVDRQAAEVVVAHRQRHIVRCALLRWAAASHLRRRHALATHLAQLHDSVHNRSKVLVAWRAWAAREACMRERLLLAMREQPVRLYAKSMSPHHVYEGDSDADTVPPSLRRQLLVSHPSLASVEQVSHWAPYVPSGDFSSRLQRLQQVADQELHEAASSLNHSHILFGPGAGLGHLISTSSQAPINMSSAPSFAHTPMGGRPADPNNVSNFLMTPMATNRTPSPLSAASVSPTALARFYDPVGDDVNIARQARAQWRNVMRAEFIRLAVRPLQIQMEQAKAAAIALVSRLPQNMQAAFWRARAHRLDEDDDQEELSNDSAESQETTSDASAVDDSVQLEHLISIIQSEASQSDSSIAENNDSKLDSSTAPDSKPVAPTPAKPNTATKRLFASTAKKSAPVTASAKAKTTSVRSSSENLTVSKVKGKLSKSSSSTSVSSTAKQVAPIPATASVAEVAPAPASILKKSLQSSLSDLTIKALSASQAEPAEKDSESDYVSESESDDEELKIHALSGGREVQHMSASLQHPSLPATPSPAPNGSTNLSRSVSFVEPPTPSAASAKAEARASIIAAATEAVSTVHRKLPKVFAASLDNPISTTQSSSTAVDVRTNKSALHSAPAHYRQLTHLARHFHARKVALRAWLIWRWALSLRLRAIWLHQRTRRRCLARFFSAMMRVYPRICQRHLIAMERGRRAMQRRLFLAWREHVHQRLRVDHLVQRMQQPVASMARFFRKWRTWTQCTRPQLLAEAQHRYVEVHQRAARKVIMHWRGICQRRQHLHALLMEFVHRVRPRRIAPIYLRAWFHSWLALSRPRALLRRTFTHAVQLWSARIPPPAPSELIASASSISHAVLQVGADPRAHYLFQYQRLHEAVAAWRALVQRRRRKNQLHADVRTALTFDSLRVRMNAFGLWKLALMRARQRFILRRACTAWRALVRRQNAARKRAVAVLHYMHCKAAFRAWKNVVQSIVSERQIETKRIYGTKDLPEGASLPAFPHNRTSTTAASRSISTERRVASTHEVRRSQSSRPTTVSKPIETSVIVSQKAPAKQTETLVPNGDRIVNREPLVVSQSQGMFGSAVNENSDTGNATASPSLADSAVIKLLESEELTAALLQRLRQAAQIGSKQTAEHVQPKNAQLKTVKPSNSNGLDVKKAIPVPATSRSPAHSRHASPAKTDDHRAISPVWVGAPSRIAVSDIHRRSYASAPRVPEAKPVEDASVLVRESLFRPTRATSPVHVRRARAHAVAPGVMLATVKPKNTSYLFTPQWVSPPVSPQKAPSNATQHARQSSVTRRSIEFDALQQSLDGDESARVLQLLAQLTGGSAAPTQPPNVERSSKGVTKKAEPVVKPKPVIKPQKPTTAVSKPAVPKKASTDQIPALPRSADQHALSSAERHFSHVQIKSEVVSQAIEQESEEERRRETALMLKAVAHFNQRQAERDRRRQEEAQVIRSRRRSGASFTPAQKLMLAQATQRWRVAQNRMRLAAKFERLANRFRTRRLFSAWLLLTDVKRFR